MRRHEFRAMGTTVAVAVGEEGVSTTDLVRAIRGVEAIFEREEQRCSRFRADSELSKVNAAAGSVVTLSPSLAALLRFALDRAAATDGLFDPAVLGAVTAAGYDRDFDDLLAGARDALRPPVLCGRWREIELRGRELRMPAGVGLDLGGVAKGWTVDLAAEAAVASFVPWALVNAGGDLRMAGNAPAADVGVEDPADPTTAVLHLTVTDGAVATSSTVRRAWGAGAHHVIDPRTGAPFDGEVAQATVWAPTCALAEIAAKRTLLEGVPGTDPAVLVRIDGDVVTNIARTEVAA